MEWSRVIEECIAAGETQVTLASAVPCAQSTISDIARGVNTNPGWKVTSALQRLHKKCKRRLARQSKEPQDATAGVAQ